MAIEEEVLAWQDGRVIKDNKDRKEENQIRKLYLQYKVLMCRVHSELEISKQNLVWL